MIRICDMLPNVRDTLAITTLIRSTVAWMVDLRARNMTFRQYERLLIAENKWRAVRYGLEGQLIDWGLEQMALPLTWCAGLVNFVTPFAERLNSLEELDHVDDLAAGGQCTPTNQSWQAAGGIPKQWSILLWQRRRRFDDGRATTDDRFRVIIESSVVGRRRPSSPYRSTFMIARPSLTLGIEEEYQIIDPKTREMHCFFITQFIDNDRVIMIERELKPELHQSMVELGTPACRNDQSTARRAGQTTQFIVGLAEQKELAVVATATHPFRAGLTSR